MRTLETLDFDNRFSRLPAAFYSRVAPVPLTAPYLVAFNDDAAALLDLDPAEGRRPALLEYLNGSRPLPGAAPLAALYAGHQFGHYVPQLGDGRAILLGEVRGPAGHVDLQLKGSGPTPYARSGDGRAVLRSTIREYLGSEAMHGLGIPTTRALCILGSDEAVHRETVESAAVLVRLAQSHVRFGSFEIFHYRSQPHQLATLADWVIDHHVPWLSGRPERHAELFALTVERTADLIARWQSVGFAHGVMNTDNMSILGLTLDYGPFAFLDAHDPGFICNHSDHGGRYAFGRQPSVAMWNLACLGEALVPLAPVAALQDALDRYHGLFQARLASLLRAKLGLLEDHPGDDALAADFLALLAAERVDFTRSFRSLGDFTTTVEGGGGASRAEGGITEVAAFAGWSARYRARLLAERSDDRARRERIHRVNPCYVLRNHLAQRAIERAWERDFSEIERLRALLSDPFTERPDMADYATPPPADHAQVTISCSS